MNQTGINSGYTKKLFENSMEIEANKYLINSIKVLRENIFPLSIPVVLGILFYIPLIIKGKPDSLFFLSMLLFFIIYPLVYGQYTEIVLNSRQISYFQIFNTHWFNFTIVSILVSSPILLITVLDTFLGEYGKILDNILSILINTMTIYVIPLIFLIRKRVKSISLGFKCLLGNFKFSLPLIVLTFFPSIFNLVVRNLSGTSNYSATFYLFNYLFWILSLLFDFVIFIAATIILKEKLLNDQMELKIIV